MCIFRSAQPVTVAAWCGRWLWVLWAALTCSFWPRAALVGAGSAAGLCAQAVQGMRTPADARGKELEGKRMRAVFLDVDGVLLPFGEGPAPGTQTEGAQDASKGAIGGEVAKIPHASLAALARILRETGAQVVLSSTWRCAGGAEALVEAFREFARLQHEALAGPTCPLGAIAETGFVHTTDPGMHSHRQWEIAAWLESAASSGIVVQSWCALDDEELVSVDPAEGGGDFNARFQALFQGRHVKTPSHIGLTDAHATAAIKQLQRPCTHAASTNGGRSRAEGATGATGGSSAARKTRDDHKASKGGREGKHKVHL